MWFWRPSAKSNHHRKDLDRCNHTWWISRTAQSIHCPLLFLCHPWKPVFLLFAGTESRSKRYTENPAIWIDNFRFAISVNGFFYHLSAPFCILTIGEALGKDLSAVHIHDGGQAHKSLGHGHIRNIGNPDLIGTVYLQVSEQVRPFILPQSHFGQILSAVNRLSSHQAKKPSDPFGTYDKAKSSHQVNHRYPSFARMAK